MIELSQGQNLHLQQKQIQTLAQHQIQSLEVLQLALQDLRAHIQEEMASNPALEMGSGPEGEDGSVADGGGEGGDAAESGDGGEQTSDFGESFLGDPMEEAAAQGSNQQELAGVAAEKDEFLANLMQVEEGWRDYVPPEHARNLASSDDEERRRFFFDSLASESTLEDVLLEQLRTADCDEQTARVGEMIIGSIDQTGYLRTSVPDLAVATGSSLREVERVLKMVQTFEPPGVGARDLRECLLLQLDRKGMRKSLAYRVVEKQIDKLARNRIPDIARALRVSKAALYEALAEIRKLQPRPGNAVSSEPDHYVLPELFVTREQDGSYSVSTNRDSVPRLRVSSLYLRLLQDPATPPETRAYIREKVNSVKMLMRSIAQRKSTIERIAEVVVRHQHDFFEDGEEAMRPLTMGEVAQEIDVHETTVSRAIANKYMDTPRGLFPLRHFFSTGYTTGDGDQLSNLSIKSKVQTLVDDEDPAKPLSDQSLVELLKEQGLKVARRTVAKYREELGIPSSHLRKRHGI